jgi:hypothetical protein
MASSPQHRDSRGLMYYQVWRKGTKWRIEQLRVPPELSSGSERDSILREQADPTAWWLEQGECWQRIPKHVSNGTVEISLDAVTSSSLPDPENPDYLLIKSYKPKRTLAFVYSQSDPRPDNHWVMPEFHAYPFLYGGNFWRYRTTVDQDPNEGPNGTIVIESEARDAAQPIRGARYWVDPNANYVVKRMQWLRGKSNKRLSAIPATGPAALIAAFASKTTDSVGELLELNRSPSGFWYPRVVRQAQNSLTEDGIWKDSYYRFYLDFEAEIPDSLFDVTEWGPVK